MTLILELDDAVVAKAEEEARRRGTTLADRISRFVEQQAGTPIRFRARCPPSKS